MHARRTLLSTDTALFRPVSVAGEEPVRNHRRTAALLRSRLKSVSAAEFDCLAEPRFLPDGKIEWSTDRFAGTPKPLSALAGEERMRYEALLGQFTDIMRAGAAEADAETRPLLEAVATVPGEDCIFCGEGRIVIAQWAMKENGADTGKELSLLSYSPWYRSASRTEAYGATAVPEQSAGTPPPALSPAGIPPNAAPPAIPPPVVPPSDGGTGCRGRRHGHIWWIIALIALLAVGWLLLRSCAVSSERVGELEPVAPPVGKEKVVPAPDSLSYIAGDRINIYVLKGGGLDDFIRRFRSEWDDRDKYRLVNPDTVLRRVVLICPEQDRDMMLREVPERMAPELEVIALYENIYQGTRRSNDPAMRVGEQSYYFDMTGTFDAWDVETGSSDVVVAVLDGDFDLSHPELEGKIVKPYDAVSHTSAIPRVHACGGHATHVGSTAVGHADNGLGAAGIAPGCSIMPVNVFTPDGQSYDSAIIDGIMYAVSQGVHVINMSLGAYWGPMMKLIPPGQLEELARTRQLREAEIWDKVFDYAESRGVTIVKAAGNDNVPAGLDPMNRSEHALVVSAVDPSGRKAVFNPMTFDGSNYGSLCRISAPGVAIYNAVPGGGYAYMPGTSMAAPQVAGGAALLKSRHRDWSPADIRKVLVGTARQAASPDVGPVMYLSAAVEASPDDLPGTEAVPDYSSGMPSPGGGLLVTPGPGGGFDKIVGGGGCDEVRRRYADLKRRRQQLDEEMERLKKECPECM